MIKMSDLAKQILIYYGLQLMLMQLLDDESDKEEVSCIVHKKLKRQIRRIKRESS